MSESIHNEEQKSKVWRLKSLWKFETIASIAAIVTGFVGLYFVYLANRFPLTYLPWPLLKNILTELILASNVHILFSLISILSGILCLLAKKSGRILMLGASLGFVLLVLMALSIQFFAFGLDEMIYSWDIVFKVLQISPFLAIFTFLASFIWLSFVSFKLTWAAIQNSEHYIFWGIAISLFLVLDNLLLILMINPPAV